MCNFNPLNNYILKYLIYFSAFIIEDYDYNDGTYASWAESSWASTSTRMFLKADPFRERGYLALGIIMLLLSFITVIWINFHASDIFESDQFSVEPAAL